MMNSKAYAQSYYVIQSLSEQMKEKIPCEVLERIKDKIEPKDKLEMLEYNSVKELGLTEDAERILSVIYTDYLATDEERELIKNKEQQLYIISEKNKKEKYDVDIFKSKTIDKERTEENKIDVVKKTRWYKMFLNKIKRIFKWL